MAATPTVGRTGVEYGSNKNRPGPETGIIPKFLATYTNDLYLGNFSASGSAMGRTSSTGTFTGYVSSGSGLSAAGNVMNPGVGTPSNANTVLVQASIPAGTMVASFGPGGSARYIYQAGVSGFGLSFATTGAPTPVTITKYDYSFSPYEGALFVGSDGTLTSGYEARAVNWLNSIGAGKKVWGIVLMLGTNDVDATIFSTALLAIIARIKSTFASYLAPGYRIILVQVKSGPNMAAIQAVQQSVADNDANVYLLSTAGAAFTLQGDNVHFTCPATYGAFTGRAAVGAGIVDIASGASNGI